jgi:hypothetical protein
MEGAPPRLTSDERNALADKGRALYRKACGKDDSSCVLGFAEHQIKIGHAQVARDFVDWLKTSPEEMTNPKDHDTRLDLISRVETMLEQVDCGG